ncbi:MAG: DUF1508 domain-containing protein [Bacilli bacterium]|nr:DUF1508 domain-containing protein [Bacilli bacterium]
MAKSESKQEQSILREVIRFLVVGVIATIFDFLTKLVAAKIFSTIGLDGEIYSGGTFNLFSPAGLNYTLSIVCGFIIGVLVNYLLSRIWVFQNVEDRSKSNSVASFFLFVFLGFIGLLISLLIFWGAVFLVPLMVPGIDVYEGSKSIAVDFSFLSLGGFWAYFIVFCVSTLIVMVWNYLSRKKWIFKAPAHKKEIQKQESKEGNVPHPSYDTQFIGKNMDYEETLAIQTGSVPVMNEDGSKKEVPEEKEEEKVETPKYQGKYEVYPEAGGYKFRLKANNGEILMVSGSYTTKAGAHKGIETFKKNVPEGSKSTQTDKNGYSQWRIFTPNDGRLIAAGEIYSSWENANNALNSVSKFYPTDKIIDLPSIPESETRDWAIDLGKIQPKMGGKIEYFLDPELEKWRARLFANNGQLLFVTDGTYVSKAGAQNAVLAIKKQIDSNSVHVLKDKQGRYQFQIANATGAVLVRGESYSEKARAVSAASSVASFLEGIKDLSGNPKKK